MFQSKGIDTRNDSVVSGRLVDQQSYDEILDPRPLTTSPEDPDSLEDPDAEDDEFDDDDEDSASDDDESDDEEADLDENEDQDEE